jgi:hypothetical protein
MSREYRYSGRFREPAYHGPALPAPGIRIVVEPDRSKAHALGCPALTNLDRSCACRLPSEEEE